MFTATPRARRAHFATKKCTSARDCGSTSGIIRASEGADQGRETAQVSMVASTCTESVASVRHPGTHLGGRSALHVDQEHDPTLMLERALNGARSCNHSSKPGAIVHRVIRDNTGVCQRDSSHAIDRTQLQCCHRERCVSVVEVIGQVVVS